MTSTPQQRHGVPYRLSFNGALCSVKWVGNLDVWPDTLAIGIEWDDPKRGKHSGTYNGQQLFTTRVEKAGSFVKATRKQDTRKSLLEALQIRYYTPNDNLVPNPDVVDFDSFKQWDIQPASRTSMSLNGLCVDKSSPGLSPYVASLKELDLSFNLFEDMSDIADIVRQCPCLVKLDISGNRFESFEVSENLAKSLSQVKQLSLLSVGLAESDLPFLAKLFDNLEVLDVSDNALHHIDIPNWPSLRTLIVNRNDLTTFPHNLQFVRELRICYNRINKAPADGPNMQVKILDIRHNDLSDWFNFDNISDLFADVTDLYVHGMPLLNNFSEKEQAILIIAHWNRGVQRLNGTKVSDDFRRNSELYYIREVVKGKLPPMEQSRPKWLELRRGNEDAFSCADNSPVQPTNRTVALTFIYKDSSITRQIPTFISVLKLKTILARLFTLSTCHFNIISNEGTSKLDDDDERVDYYNLASNQTLKIELKSANPSNAS